MVLQASAVEVEFILGVVLTFGLNPLKVNGRTDCCGESVRGVALTQRVYSAYPAT